MQAAQVGATVIVDDAWGRDLATRDGLDVHGTVWILQRLHELRVVSSSGLRGNFMSLRARGTWLPWKLVDELLKSIGEDPLDDQI